MSDARTDTLCLIPAKGGSTRLAQKNIRKLGGRSLLAWAAAAARDSALFERIVVSTEDTAVADEARALGLDVPFMRPMALARDPAGVVDVALHALDALEAAGTAYRKLVILLPTCPFRTGDDVRAAWDLFHDRNAVSLMSVSEFDHTPFAAQAIDADGMLVAHFPQWFGKKSQEMPAAYRPNSAIHILDVDRLRETRSYIAPPVLAYVMPRERSIDIDTADDLYLAEAMLARRADEGAP